MTKTPLKWLLVGMVVFGTGVTGIALLRGQGNKGTPSKNPTAELKEVRKDLTSMHQSFQKTRAMLKRAKKKKDIIRINCIMRKLEQMRNLIMLAREQYSKYLMKKASNSSAGSSSTMSLKERVNVFKEQVDEKEQEARQCSGEAIKVTDKPEVKEFVDPMIPRGDPTQPSGSVWVMPRPPEASPFL